MDGKKALLVPDEVDEVEALEGLFITDRASLARILAEELRMPLTEAVQALSYARLEQDLGSLHTAQNVLKNSLRLLDQYITSGELLRQDQPLTNNTITIGALLEEVAHRTYEMAAQYNVNLMVDYSAIKRPILVDTEKVSTLLENLISAFIRLPAKYITLGAHISKNGIRTGVFSDDLASSTLESNIRELANKASKPAGYTASGSAHLLIADWLGQKLTLPITLSRHSRSKGVAITIPWSQQLSLL